MRIWTFAVLPSEELVTDFQNHHGNELVMHSLAPAVILAPQVYSLALLELLVLSADSADH